MINNSYPTTKRRYNGHLQKPTANAKVISSKNQEQAKIFALINSIQHCFRGANYFNKERHKRNISWEKQNKIFPCFIINIET